MLAPNCVIFSYTFYLLLKHSSHTQYIYQTIILFSNFGIFFKQLIIIRYLIYIYFKILKDKLLTFYYIHILFYITFHLILLNYSHIFSFYAIFQN